MYAIVEIAGQQFKVEKDQKILVQKLEQEEGSQFDIDSVLLLDNDKNVLVGEPLISGAKIVARVLSHTKGDKIKVFKKKKRKGYQILKGHRQHYTEIMIEEILENAGKDTRAAGAKKEKPAVKEAEKAKEVKEKETPTEVPVSEQKQAKTTRGQKVTAKKDAGMTAEETKPAVKKTTAKKPVHKVSESKTAGEKSDTAQKADKKKAEVKKSAEKKPAIRKKNIKK